MSRRRILRGALLLCPLVLTGCFETLPVSAPSLLPASLLAPCPPLPELPLLTNQDLVDAYLMALASLDDCRARHAALADAARAQTPSNRGVK